MLLQVANILNALCTDDVFTSDARDVILSQSTQKQRVCMLLDGLEHRGDAAFALFMDQLRDHFKHLHYALDEALRSLSSRKDATLVESRLAASGDTVRRVLRQKSARRKRNTSRDSLLDDVTAQPPDPAYTHCYVIPNFGRQTDESWLEPASELAPADVTTDDVDDSYMGVIVRDLLFKRVNVKDVPSGVSTPAQTSAVFVLDRDNKYGQVRKPGKERRVAVDVIDASASVEQVPGYTAPLPPSASQLLASPVSSLERKRDDSDSEPPPPLPPKPGNLPALNNLSESKPEARVERMRVEVPDPTLNEVTTEDGEVIKPPPRSTSLAQTFDHKPLPLPTRKGSASKSIPLKKRHYSGSSVPDADTTAAPAPAAATSSTSDAQLSPPVPPRRYVLSPTPPEEINLRCDAAPDLPPSSPPPPPPHSPCKAPARRATSVDFDPYSLHAEEVLQVRVASASLSPVSTPATNHVTTFFSLSLSLSASAR